MGKLEEAFKRNNHLPGAEEFVNLYK
jgi:CTD small phosphatase-like protein 2